MNSPLSLIDVNWARHLPSTTHQLNFLGAFAQKYQPTERMRKQLITTFFYEKQTYDAIAAYTERYRKNEWHQRHWENSTSFFVNKQVILGRLSRGTGFFLVQPARKQHPEKVKYYSHHPVGKIKHLHLSKQQQKRHKRLLTLFPGTHWWRCELMNDLCTKNIVTNTWWVTCICSFA